jgi:FkbM family methyltransferase
MVGTDSLFVRRVFRAPGYVRNFGLWQGLRLLIAIEKRLPKSSDRIQAFRVPGYGPPIFLRRCVADHSIFRQCFVMQQYDFRIWPQYRRLKEEYAKALARGEAPLIIDGGANVGLATRWFAAHFPEAKIASIEPHPGNFEMLKRNTKAFESRISCLQGGLWDRPARLKIINPDAGATAYRVEEHDVNEANGIRAYTISEICELAGVASPFIVKLDIEGAQSYVFRSNTEWVDRAHLITLELDDWLLPWSGSSRSFFYRLSKRPFDYLMREESIFCFNDFEAMELKGLDPGPTAEKQQQSH